MDQHDYQILFSKLQEIDKNINQEELQSRSAFNIFNILRKSTEEVKLHSRFLSELLNPKGSHGTVIFQKLFIEEVINKNIGLEDKDSQWKREKITNIQKYFNCNYEVALNGYGRIDILLENDEKIIVIENKIEAQDQKNQLQRYYNACKKVKGYDEKDIYVLYLNLHGELVSAKSKGNLLEKDFVQITYKEDILQWLECCLAHDEIKKYAHIQQTIIQYCTLIKKLTGLGTKNMTKQHIDLLYQGNNFKLAQQISNSLDKFKIDLQNKFWKELQQSLQQKGYQFFYCDKNLKSIEPKSMCNNYYKERKAIRLYGIQSQLGFYKNYSIHCFIQVNHHIYYGITIAKNDGNGKLKRLQYGEDCHDLHEKILNLHLYKKEIITSPLNFSKKSIDTNWFLGANILPKDEVNFLTLNETFYDLIDKEKRKEWIARNTGEIDLFIKAIKDLNILDD